MAIGLQSGDTVSQIVDQSQMTPWQMFTLSNTAVVWVEMDVYEKDIHAVHVGQKLTVTVAALPNRTFTATVRRIAPALDKTTRALKVRAEIANADGLLKDVQCRAPISSTASRKPPKSSAFQSRNCGGGMNRACSSQSALPEVIGAMRRS